MLVGKCQCAGAKGFSDRGWGVVADEIHGTAVEVKCRVVREAVDGVVPGVVESEGIGRCDTSDHTGADSDRARAAHDARATNDHGALGDRQAALRVGTGESERVAADLGEQCAADRAIEGNVASRCAAADRIDPVGADTGGGAKDEGAVHHGCAGGAIDQRAKRVTDGGKVGAASADDGEEFCSRLAVQVEHRPSRESGAISSKGSCRTQRVLIADLDHAIGEGDWPEERGVIGGVEKECVCTRLGQRYRACSGIDGSERKVTVAADRGTGVESQRTSEARRRAAAVPECTSGAICEHEGCRSRCAGVQECIAGAIDVDIA